MNDSKPIAKAYLKTDGDESNSCLLFENNFIIYFKSKRSQFPLEWIQEILFQHKIFIIPIVFGGISSSLSALALFQYDLNPWLILSILFASLFTLYYGIQGGETLVVRTPIKDYDYFIMEKTENMKAFIAYFNSFKKGYQANYYLHLSAKDVEEAFESGYIKTGKSGLRLHTNPNPANPELKAYVIDTKNSSISIKYIKDSDNTLVPIIYDNISVEAFTISNG